MKDKRGREVKMATIPGKAKFDISNLGKTINTSDPTLMN